MVGSVSDTIPLGIVLSKNGNLDMALRKLKQKLARESVPSECKKREFAVKPGDKRREAKKAGI